MRNIVMLLPGVAVIVVSLYVVSGWRAVKRADDICGEIKLGISDKNLNTIAKSHNGYLDQIPSDNEIVTGASGGGMNCRCRVQIKSNVVINVTEPVCIE